MIVKRKMWRLDWSVIRQGMAKKGKSPQQPDRCWLHSWPKNWQGDLFLWHKILFFGFTLLNSCGVKNAVVSVLVEDDDSSTISKVRKNVEHEVEKWSDVVNAKRSFGSSLYSIKTENKTEA
ncbi:uncharacterized protein LOC111347637 [Stylophora pistillata]|uniref:uncharacterized protein LOC111347637 n=1 Tax=Stylophora pistillata TaxID=50429 RepID=UPI000C0506D9|nr:uncharacterized protein LOC111347637 [Stylophora pistillata]